MRKHAKNTRPQKLLDIPSKYTKFRTHFKIFHIAVVFGHNQITAKCTREPQVIWQSNLVPRVLPMGKTLVGAGHVTLQK